MEDFGFYVKSHVVTGNWLCFQWQLVSFDTISSRVCEIAGNARLLILLHVPLEMRKFAQDQNRNFKAKTSSLQLQW